MKHCQHVEPTPEQTTEFIHSVTLELVQTYQDSIGVNHSEGNNLPRETEVLAILGKLLELIYPGFGTREAYSMATLRFSVGEIISALYVELSDILQRTLNFHCRLTESCGECTCGQQAQAASRRLLAALPRLREIVKKDIQAAYDGDPAARSFDEVVISYPGLKAITIQRLAHILYMEKIPMIPRIMTEYAHRITAIDIHPGACIGEGFFIDHGTGVVIGETATIGNNVKLYQGVTLGAHSFPKDACGKIIKGAKRHPDIEDNVTIYAGATILGNVTIGANSVIGGNVWLTESVPPGTKVRIADPELTIKKPEEAGR